MRKQRPHYMEKTSTQTLREGLEEYYAVNPHVIDPRGLPAEISKILLAHDISHVVYGCGTSMYDELKILPLTWWTSDYKFWEHVHTMQKPGVSPSVHLLYEDLLKERGAFWVYTSVIFMVLQLLPELIFLWLKTRDRQRWVPFMDFDPLLDRPLLEIRQDFDLLPLMK